MRELVSESGHNVRREGEGVVICETAGEGGIRWVQGDFVRIAMLMQGPYLPTQRTMRTAHRLLPRQSHQLLLALEPVGHVLRPLALGFLSPGIKLQLINTMILYIQESRG